MTSVDAIDGLRSGPVIDSSDPFLCRRAAFQIRGYDRLVVALSGEV